MKYKITGGQPVSGRIEALGTKNIASKVIVASMLTDQEVVLLNVPDILEIEILKDMLVPLGVEIEHDLKAATMKICSRNLKSHEVLLPDSGSNRIPILMIAPLLHKFKKAKVPVLGGCYLGERKIDFHVQALRAAGAVIEGTDYGYEAEIESFSPIHFKLDYPSMGATETFLFISVLAAGTSILENAGLEPELIETVTFLRGMGAIIHITPDRKIIVEGVKKLKGTTFFIVGDRMDACAWACLACATKGRIVVEGIRPDTMGSFYPYFTKLGGGFDIIDKDKIEFYRKDDKLTPISIETDVAPGFATDWQPLIAILLVLCEGVSTIHDTVYENRFGYLGALSKLGADTEPTTHCLGSVPCRFQYKNHPHSVMIKGPAKLKSDNLEIRIPDLRAGLAYVIAASVAEGTTILTNLDHIKRGFGNIIERTKHLSLKIEQID
ncbi:MAG TPA: UDP-N-acetylglucosamine 1-carboxyvinyltransferase [Puia sp.]|nr:UDP-N-acetylglucosamine 1-carboxyvinyltransferase [Puia sp.]